MNEQTRLREAKNSIVYWHKKEGNQFSWNEICAHALCLISEIRIKNYEESIERIETFQRMSMAPPPISVFARTTLTITNMNIHLSASYYSKTTSDGMSFDSNIRMLPALCTFFIFDYLVLLLLICFRYRICFRYCWKHW